MLKLSGDLRVSMLFVLLSAFVSIGFAQTAPAARPAKPASQRTATKPAAKPAAAPAAAAGAGGPAHSDADTVGGYEARPIGPAQTGGRVADLEAVHEGQKLTIYVG